MKQLFLNTIVGASSGLDQLAYLQALEERGDLFQGIELRNELDDVLAMSAEKIQAYKDLADKHDWTYFLSIPGDLFVEEGLRPDLETILQAARALDIKSLKFNSGPAKAIEKVDANEIQALYDKYKIFITIENGQTEENGRVEVFEYLIQEINDQGLPFGITFDLGNWLFVDTKAKDAYDSIKDDVTTFHVKNVDKEGQPVLLDEGVAAWREFLDLDIPYLLEYDIPEAVFDDEVKKFKEALGEW